MAFVEWYGLDHKVIFGDENEATFLGGQLYVDNESGQLRVRVFFVPFPNMLMQFRQLRNEADPETGIVSRTFRYVDMKPIQEWGPQRTRTRLLVNVNDEETISSQEDAALREMSDQAMKIAHSQKLGAHALVYALHKQNKYQMLQFEDNLEPVAKVIEKLRLRVSEDKKDADR